MAQNSEPVATPVHWALLMMLTWAFDSSRDRAGILVEQIYSTDPPVTEEGSIASSQDPHRLSAWVDDLLARVRGGNTYEKMEGVLRAAVAREPDVPAGLIDQVRVGWLEERVGGPSELAFLDGASEEAALAHAFLHLDKLLGVVLTTEFGELPNNSMKGRRPSVHAGDVQAKGTICVVALIEVGSGELPREELLAQALERILGSMRYRVWTYTTVDRLKDTGRGTRAHKPVSSTSFARVWQLEWIAIVGGAEP